MAEPTMIRCEGSGAVNPWCPMCALAADEYGVVPEHTRRDILADLARGDFAPLTNPGDHRARRKRDRLRAQQVAAIERRLDALDVPLCEWQRNIVIVAMLAAERGERLVFSHSRQSGWTMVHRVIDRLREEQP